ncbi:hypothetical protein SAMN04487948_104143 [Halogranum amylolyticum]|uniref:DUF7577 domain-containing protein n=1 Tax=Halogranum amylolyticum TaxID=660520 RepID=A0A1H8RNR6_9EURY|nr:zinc ribbon domain-containing protein [Halogranum amylolyticum]SEO68015.1 hypothetical protein SAMN04487948_104143 [Halogranum amylolyticum]
MELAFRLLVAAFVIVAPSALFVGLWHGLHALRDDRLVARMEEHARESERRSTLTPASLLSPTGGESPTARPSLVDCGSCGTPNPDDVTFCHECLSKLR